MSILVSNLLQQVYLKGVYSGWLFFVSVGTNKRHHHQLSTKSVLSQVCVCILVSNLCGSVIGILEQF